MNVSRSKKSSPAQLSFLVEFMGKNPDMAQGNLAKGLQERIDSEQQWKWLAEHLNSLGGPKKSTSRWKQVWRDKRNKIKKKLIGDRNEYQEYIGNTSEESLDMKSLSTAEGRACPAEGSVAIYLEDGASVAEITMDSPGSTPENAEVDVKKVFPNPDPSELLYSPKITQRHTDQKPVSTSRKSTQTQLSFLVKFMSKNPNMAQGKLPKGLQDRIEFERQWKWLAKHLNSLRGPKKSISRWKQVWRDKRNKIRKQFMGDINEYQEYIGNTSDESLDMKSTAEGRACPAEGPVTIYLEDGASVPEITMDSPGSTPENAEVDVKKVFPDPDPSELLYYPKIKRRHTDQKPVSVTEAMKIGFLGGGRLAFALANGFITAGLAKPDEITASVHPSDLASAEAFRTLGATAVFENRPVVERSDVVIVSVKPDVVGSALKEVRDLPASRNKLFISVAMGVSIKVLERSLPNEARVIRVMPNTPALVQQGAAAFSRGSNATSEDASLTTKLFTAVGTCDEVPEYQMDAVTALSGSGPAYIYMLIESLAEGGVRCGLPRDLALRLAAQTTMGAAKMVKEGTHPAILKDNVTSPAGSTADGTYHLEKNGFRSALIGAVGAACTKCKGVNEQLNKVSFCDE